MIRWVPQAWRIGIFSWIVRWLRLRFWPVCLCLVLLWFLVTHWSFLQSSWPSPLPLGIRMVWVCAEVRPAEGCPRFCFILKVMHCLWDFKMLLLRLSVSTSIIVPFSFMCRSLDMSSSSSSVPASDCGSWDIKAVQPPKIVKIRKIGPNRRPIHCHNFVLWTNLANHYSLTFYWHFNEIVY